MEANSAASEDHSTAAEVVLEKIVSGDTIELTDVSLETEGLYHCEKCRQNFSDSNLFSSHRCAVSPLASRAPRMQTLEEAAVKTRSDQYKCPLCDETFPLPSALKRHFKNHGPLEPAGPLRCSEPGCQFAGADRREYQAHLLAAHSLKLVPCAFRACRLAFRTLEEMEKHRRDHMPFHCAQCDFAAANAKQFSEHRRRSHRPDPGDEGEKVGDSEKMEVRSRGNGPCVRGRRKRPLSSTLPTADESREEEEEEEEGGGGEKGRSNKRAREETHSEETAAAAGSEGHLSTCHVAEGTEHMFRTHICPECRRCFKKRTHLLEHMHLHFPDPRLQCPTCGRHFTSKSKLSVHLLRESGHKPHGCRLCEYRAVERNALRRHLASVHGEEEGSAAASYPCPACGKAFRLSRALKAHMKTHRGGAAPTDAAAASSSPDGPPPLACFREGCGFRGADRRELRRHAADAHGVPAVECRHHACRAFFGSREEMEAHRRTHLAFHCGQCDFSCSNKSRFQRHRREGHAGERRLACAFCPFATFNPVEFEGHVGRLHANEKTHRCPQCGFVTAHKRVLGRHMLLHTGEKPHKCKLCNFRCRDETYLSKHMLTHSDDKNHMCSVCGYVTKWKHYLNVHMRKHAGDLRYQCDQCSYRCHRADQLSSHKLRHQGKSLICEVCAFSCKRKSELRKHMQLKHAQGGEPPPPVFQCKYCAYRTPYRQALSNHENCKHTRLREFRCALCAYGTFSSTSLFLHKRKAHGYVPGDKAWLERYAARERENAGSDGPRGFYPGPVAPMPAAAPPSGGGGVSVRAGAAGNAGGGGGDRGLEDGGLGPGASREEGGGGPEERGGSDAVCRESAVGGIGGSVDGQEGCPSVSPSMTGGERTAGNGGGTASERTPGDPESLLARGVEPASPSRGASDAEEDDALMADRGQQSDEEGEGAASPGEAERRGRVAGAALGQTPREEEPAVPPGCPEASAVGEDPPRPESPLKALKRRDREQADALVLEGRVQMLVVQTKGSVYRCERCPYAARKQASLSRHRRSACAATRAALKCQDCGAQFKQQRGLDTHRLRKCPVILKSRRFPRPTAAGSSNESRAEPRGEPATQSDQSGGGSHGNEPGEPGAAPPQAGREEETPSCFTQARREWAESTVPEEQAGKKLTAIDQANSPDPGEPASTKESSLSSEGVLGYGKEGGRFKCNKCAFTSSRPATIERHCTACAVKNLKQKAAKSSKPIETVETEEDNSDEDYEGEEDTGELQRDTKRAARFSCPSCPFVCHQKRALDRHLTRGCLKPGDVQCQRCSFVAKSEEALRRHARVHGERRPAPARPGGRARLRCDLCPFTCKQSRCLAQHVALKHEGAKPHACRFCGFATARRYRLEAHESLHTGVGRHPCPLCQQTFGTTSKLRLHRRRVHERRPTHFCPSCDYGGYSLNDVGRHALSCHTGELLRACDLCAARFSSDTALKQHRLRLHRDPPLRPEGPLAPRAPAPGLPRLRLALRHAGGPGGAPQDPPGPPLPRVPVRGPREARAGPPPAGAARGRPAGGAAAEVRRLRLPLPPPAGAGAPRARPRRRPRLPLHRLPVLHPQPAEDHLARARAHGREALPLRAVQLRLRRPLPPEVPHENSPGRAEVSLSRVRLQVQVGQPAQVPYDQTHRSQAVRVRGVRVPDQPRRRPARPPRDAAPRGALLRLRGLRQGLQDALPAGHAPAQAQRGAAVRLPRVPPRLPLAGGPAPPLPHPHAGPAIPLPPLRLLRQAEVPGGQTPPPPPPRPARRAGRGPEPRPPHRLPARGPSGGRGGGAWRGGAWGRGARHSCDQSGRGTIELCRQACLEHSNWYQPT